jgi:hypothetical protein
MRRLNAEGKLKGPQLQYFEPTKPVEELYDTKTDPHEVNNLAGKSKHKEVLERMREVHAKWASQTGDIGLMPEAEFDEIKQPGGQVRKTAEPVFRTPKWPVGAGAEKASRVTISCPTPGASIAYRIDDAGKSKGGWMLYAKGVWLREGQTLHAKACRIGFKDSGEATFKVGDNTPAKQPQAPDADPDHWRNKVAGEMLERLREIKALDGQGEKAIPQYTQALGDKHASVRYWAVIGLHTGCTSAKDKELGVSALEKMLKDPAAVVRVAAAHALCDWGREKDALPILIEGLSATDKTDKARLYAVIALNKIGEKARPALPQIQAALKDSDNYVQRVARTTLDHLENK